MTAALSDRLTKQLIYDSTFALFITVCGMHYVTAYVAFLRQIVDEMIDSLESDTARGFWIASFILIPLFGTFFFLTILVYAAEDASTPLATFSLAYGSGDNFVVWLRHNTDLLNAGEVEIRFDPSIMTVTNLQVHDGLCDQRFLMTKEIDNVQGRVFYQCGTLTPFEVSDAPLATLSYEGILNDETIHFGSQTNAYLHDGLGTPLSRTLLAFTQPEEAL